MIASEFEYRHRFAIIALVFIFAYAFYNLDHLNIVYAIVPRNLGVLDRNVLARFVYGVSALLASIGAAILTWASAYRLSSPRGDQPDSRPAGGRTISLCAKPALHRLLSACGGIGLVPEPFGISDPDCRGNAPLPSPYRARRDAAGAAVRRALSRILQARSTAPAVKAPTDCG